MVGLLRWCVGGGVLVVLVACGGGVHAVVSGVSGTPVVITPLAQVPAMIEVDVFSGRPNPRWQPTVALVEEVFQRVSALPKVAARAFPSQLGYRGFVVQVFNGSRGVPTRVTVYRQTVWVEEGASMTTYDDDAQAIEGWLLTQAQVFLPTEEGALVRSLVQGGR